ncbi:hypothetical protein PoMZ_05091 [Pyricularia oryzae]|uniref:Uncharacterized protein n=1 Tax=Pyricularia oryzae TaxID=318829 RepID=A0A4P7NMS6_PYROR|nr:hypothetical protein PoMZ_05091 [Pyricularia oryzae]
MREYNNSCRPTHKSITGTVWHASSTSVDQSPDLIPRQQLLGLVGTKNARAHRRRRQRLDVAQNQHKGGLVRRQSGCGTDCAKQRGEVRRGRWQVARRRVGDAVDGLVLPPRGLDGRHVLGNVPVWRERRGEAALPQADQRAALRHAGAAGDGADERGVEAVVQVEQTRRVAVGGQGEGEGGGCKGRDGEREEGGEG